MFKMTSKLGALALMVFTLTPPAQAQAPAPEAFQGLPWGASLQTIQKSFPSARSVPVCSDAKGDQAWRDIGRSCQALTVSKYPVNELAFQIMFYLSANDLRLAGVYLMAFVEGEDDTVESRREVMGKCDGLQALLSQRYGAGESPWSSITPEMTSRSKRWSTEGTVVSMLCKTARKGLSLSVSYSPAVEPAALKL
jgi:hypothetical protein